MTIRPLPPAPSRDDPGSFSDKANTLLAALPDFVSDANALEQSLQWVATTGTSATPLTIGTGSKTLTTQPDKAWVVGAWVYVVSVSGLGNIMQGQVTAYNVVTGSLTLNVVGAAGSGTRSDWIIGLAAAIASAGTIGVADAANRFAGGNIEAVLTELARLDGDIIKAGGNGTDPLHLVPKQQMEEADAAILSAANSAIAAAQAAIEAKLLGVSQTWQTVSRAGGTTYFNTTGRPIVLQVNGVTSGANVAGTVSISINGGGTFNFAAGGGATVGQTFVYGSVVIPIAASYVVNYSNIAGGVTTYELR